MVLKFGELVLRLPGWVENFLAKEPEVFEELEKRMRLVVELARLNVEHKSGGPFAAGIFEQQSGKLLAVGVNLVASANCSIAHAEIVCIALAQQKLGCYDLGSENTPAYELVTSTEPCAMCLGAIPWSGVRRIVCGTRDADARQIGFDEGDKPNDWVEKLEKRGITVLRDVCRDQAQAVLEYYVESGGVIYNGRGR